MSGAPEGYVEVKDRIVAFLNKYPEGSLQPFDPKKPYEVVTLDETTWIVYTACAFREPKDVSPGIGCAWEQYPGKTPFTKGSELMNAETSAWGRALAALGFEVHKSVASAEEVEQAKARSNETGKRAAAKPSSRSGGAAQTTPSPAPVAEAVAALPGTVELVGPATVEAIKALRADVGLSAAALKAHVVATHGKDSLEALTLEEGQMVSLWLEAKKAKAAA